MHLQKCYRLVKILIHRPRLCYMQWSSDSSDRRSIWSTTCTDSQWRIQDCPERGSFSWPPKSDELFSGHTLRGVRFLVFLPSQLTKFSPLPTRVTSKKFLCLWEGFVQTGSASDSTIIAPSGLLYCCLPKENIRMLNSLLGGPLHSAHHFCMPFC